MAKAPKKFAVESYRSRNGRTTKFQGTIDELVQCFSYTLECGASYAHEKGNKKINRNPTTIKSLISNLNNAVNNSAANGYAGETFTEVEYTPV